MLEWMRAVADPPCPWTADAKRLAEEHFGAGVVAAWGRTQGQHQERAERARKRRRGHAPT